MQTTMREAGVQAGKWAAKNGPGAGLKVASREAITQQAGQAFVGAAWTRKTTSEDFAEYVAGYLDGFGAVRTLE